MTAKQKRTRLPDSAYEAYRDQFKTNPKVTYKSIGRELGVASTTVTDRFEKLGIERGPMLRKGTPPPVVLATPLPRVASVFDLGFALTGERIAP